MLATMTRTPSATRPARALSDRVAIVTGSTSGIGLGIARAFAAQGADLMLNGFGEPEAIEAVRASIERDFGVRARFCAH